MTRPNSHPFIAAVVLGVVAFPARALSAEPAPAPGAEPEAVEPKLPRPKGRELGGHVFTPVLGMVGPFATTDFGSFMLVGGGSTEGSLTLQLPGNPFPPPQTFTGNVSYAAVGGVLGFEYEFVRDFSARLSISETIYSGLSGASAAVVGSNARLGGDFGITAGIPIGRSARIAAVVDVSYVPRFGLLLGPAIESTFQRCSQGTTTCKLDLGDLFQRQNVFGVEPGVAASWAPARALGVTGNLSYVYTSIAQTNQATSGQGGISLGAAVDFDFMAISHVPIGLQVNWTSLFAFTGGESGNGYTDLGLGFFYTGRKDLSLGLQVVDRRFRVAPDVDVSWTNVIGLIGLRYYWE